MLELTRKLKAMAKKKMTSKRRKPTSASKKKTTITKKIKKRLLKVTKKITGKKTKVPTRPTKVKPKKTAVKAKKRVTKIKKVKAKKKILKVKKIGKKKLTKKAVKTKKKVKAKKKTLKAKKVKKKVTKTKKRAKKKKVRFLEDITQIDFLNGLVGIEGMDVAKKIFDIEVSDGDLAENMDMRPNIIRKHLYAMYEAGVVTYRRHKSKTGWYTYFWKLHPERIDMIMGKVKETSIDELQDILEYEKNNQFFECGNKCTRATFEEAYEREFICPRCEKQLEHADNSERINELLDRIEKLRSIEDTNSINPQ